MKLMCGVMALACVPATLASSSVPYPKENVAAFVVENLGVAGELLFRRAPQGM